MLNNYILIEQKAVSNMRMKKGISLVVLVVTIIVMVILTTSVIINFSQSDLVNSANDVVKSAEIREEQELLQRVSAIAQGNGIWGRLDEEQFKLALSKVKTQYEIEVITQGDKLVVKFLKEKRYYELDSSGRIEGPYVLEIK